MTYYKTTTDASNLYRSSSAAEGDLQGGTAVSGNLSDIMKNSTIIRATLISPVLVYENNSAPTTSVRNA